MADLQLRLSFTPDPDDAFAWWAIATGRIAIPRVRIHCTPMHIQDANAACVRGELDIAAISVAAYPLFANRYFFLSVGASVGRGYGPALVTRTGGKPDLMAETIAVPGDLTTGALLLRLLYPGVRTAQVPCNEMAAAILRGDFHAGVLIHEELLNWQHKGLRRFACLGTQWQQATGLPIPVGLIAVHRKHGYEMAQSIASALLQSIHLAHDNRAEALAWALRFTCQASNGIGEHFVDMFTNQDSLELAPDCIEALHRLYAAAHEARLIPNVPALEPVAIAEQQLCAGK